MEEALLNGSPFLQATNGAKQKENEISASLLLCYKNKIYIIK